MDIGTMNLDCGYKILDLMFYCGHWILEDDIDVNDFLVVWSCILNETEIVNVTTVTLFLRLLTSKVDCGVFSDRATILCVLTISASQFKRTALCSVSSANTVQPPSWSPLPPV